MEKKIENYNLELKKFLKKFDIQNPKNLSIYVEAFTHKSYANENNLKYNYERLEFLGDSAIDWVVTNNLYNFEKKSDEGSLSLIRSNLVKKQTLAKCCIDMGLDKFIKFGKGAKNNISNESIYEDVFESFIGAVARDQGIKKVIKIIEKTVMKYYKNSEFKVEKDYKTQLQELLQSKGINPPEYQKITTDHSKIKKVIVLYDGCVYGSGDGLNFKEAEQNAAKDALDKLIRI